MTNSITCDPDDVVTIGSGTINTISDSYITIHDPTLYPGKISIDISDIHCDGFIITGNSGDKVEFTKEELETLLGLATEESRLREENTIVKEAWRKYQMALKLARNSDSDK